MMRAANNAAIRSAIGLGQTDAPTFLAQSLTGQSLTGTQSTSLLDLATTWLSTTGTPTAIKLNVIDTASNVNSLLMNLMVNGSSKFFVAKDGYTFIGNSSTYGNRFAANGQIFGVYGGTDRASLSLQSEEGQSAKFSLGSTAASFVISNSAASVRLAPDADNILAQRNGTNAQAFRVYNTYTDASNYQRLSFGFASGVAQILSSGAGTSGHAALTLGTGTGTWQFTTAGNFIALADNTYDIGASGANRPKDIHAGNSFAISGWTLTSTGVSYAGVNMLSWNGTRFNVGSTTHALVMSSTIFRFNGDTSAFPAIKRNGTGIDIVLADDSGFGPAQSLYQRFGSGTPEGVVTAPIGATYNRTNGGAGTSLYVKESSPTPSTGWVAK
jgi:hypothetical protein